MAPVGKTSPQKPDYIRSSFWKDVLIFPLSHGHCVSDWQGQDKRVWAASGWSRGSVLPVMMSLDWGFAMMQEGSFTAEAEGQHVSLGLSLSPLVYLTLEGQHRANRSGWTRRPRKTKIEFLYLLKEFSSVHPSVSYMWAFGWDYNHFKHKVVSFCFEVVLCLFEGWIYIMFVLKLGFT